jgi:hypothetical protein
MRVRAPTIVRLSNPRSGPGGTTTPLASARRSPIRFSRSRRFYSSQPPLRAWCSVQRPSAENLWDNSITAFDARVRAPYKRLLSKAPANNDLAFSLRPLRGDLTQLRHRRQRLPAVLPDACGPSRGPNLTIGLSRSHFLYPSNSSFRGSRVVRGQTDPTSRA